jgi:hypothetical protein
LLFSRNVTPLTGVLGGFEDLRVHRVGRRLGDEMEREVGPVLLKPHAFENGLPAPRKHLAQVALERTRLDRTRSARPETALRAA